ncbi:Hypothetical predicted protein, partial [Paramuricea clavata]
VREKEASVEIFKEASFHLHKWQSNVKELEQNEQSDSSDDTSFAKQQLGNESKAGNHVTPILQQLAWLPVECVLKLRDAVTTYKCLKGLAPSYLCDKFQMRSKIHSVNTRNKDKLDIPLYNSASGQRTFHYRAVSIWNELPNHIKDIDTLNRFKIEYKRHLLHGFLESS